MKSNKTHSITVINKQFVPDKIKIQKSDTVEFVIDPRDKSRGNYVIWVGDLYESDLLSINDTFKTRMDDCGTFDISWSINYGMKGSIEVVMPMPTRKEWESPVAPVANESPNVSRNFSGTVDSVKSWSSTSIEAIKDRDLNEQLLNALRRKESIELNNDLKQKLAHANIDINSKEKPKTDEENKEAEAQEKKFLEQQRNSSLGSRAKSRSNKQTPESDNSKDTAIFEEAKWFRKLNLEDEPEKGMIFKTI